MKILIVCQYYYPEQFQINEIAPELVKRGHDVTVLTGLPNYPGGKIYSGYKKRKKRIENKDGVDIIRCFEIGRGNNPISLICNYISYMLSAGLKIGRLKKNFDAILVYQLSPITMAFPAIKLKKKRGIPILLYCLDLWPESARAHVSNTNGLLYKQITKISKKAYSACDRIAVTSLPFIEYLNVTHNIEIERMTYLPQHGNDAYLNLDLSSIDNEIIDFMYAGNIGAGQCVDVIIRAAALIKDRNDFKVHIVGYGSKYDEVAALSKELGVEDKVIFYGQQKTDKMPEFYKKADVLLLTLRGDNFVGNTLPGKLQMYMTTGKPILAAINGAASQVIAEAKAGLCAAAGDFEGLAKNMLYYICNADEFKNCGENARSYFSAHFTKKTFIDDLEKELYSLTDINENK